MTIRYNNGFRLEGILLSRNEDSMRVAVPGSDEVVEFTKIRGAWISDDCEPVQVEFAWTPQPAGAQVTEEDCICSQELANRLIHLLQTGENEPEGVPVGQTMPEAVYHHVV